MKKTRIVQILGVLFLIFVCWVIGSLHSADTLAWAKQDDTNVTLSAALDDGISIIIEGSRDILPEGTTVKARNLDEQESLTAIANSIGANEIDISSLKIIEVSLLDVQGQKIQPSSSVTLTFSQMGLKNDAAFVWRVSKNSDGSYKTEKVPTKEANANKLIVETDQLSTFAVASKLDVKTSAEDTSDDTDSLSQNNTSHEDAIGENPDHLAAPEKAAQIAIDENILPETDFGNPLAIIPKMFSRYKSALAREGTTSSGPVIGVDHPENPGDAMLFKSVEPVAGMVNTWDVTLRIEGKDNPKTSDIVLVIDRSGSMRDHGRMSSAKAAARDLIAALLPSEYTRIAVVSYASDVSVNQGLTNNTSSLTYAINNLSATGGTFTQAGIRQAEALLDNSSADYKHIVLLSDGEPTFSYRIDRPQNYLQRVGDHYETSTAVPEDAFLYPRRVGNGNSIYTYMGWGTNYYNHGNSTIAEAGFAKDDGYVMWTIALEAGATGDRILSDIASPDKAYVATPDQLQEIFQAIAGKINSAVKDASVSDPMGTGFVIPIGSVSDIQATQGEATYDTATRKINWNIGTLTKPITTGSDIKYAEIHYRVEIDDGILNAQGEDGNYSTNGNATVKYTDAAGDEQEKVFPVPKVDPILLIIEKHLYDKNGNEVTNSDDQVFSIRITSDRGYDKTYQLKAGERKVMTNIRLEDIYTVEEVGYPAGKSAADYLSECNIYNAATNTFKIRQSSPDSPVSITNREIPTLTLKKQVTGTLGDKTKKFNFNLSIKRDSTTILDAVQISLADGESKNIKEVLPAGVVLQPKDKIVITETSGDGYNITYTIDNGSIQDGTGATATFSLLGDTTVSFKNEKMDVPLTGLTSLTGNSVLPQVIALGGAISILSVVITRYRGLKREE